MFVKALNGEENLDKSQSPKKRGKKNDGESPSKKLKSRSESTFDVKSEEELIQTLSEAWHNKKYNEIEDQIASSILLSIFFL